MPIISTTLHLSLTTLTSIISILSFVIPFTLLPLILTIDIARFLFTPLYEEAARTIHKANSYWGVGDPRRILHVVREVRRVITGLVNKTLSLRRNFITLHKQQYAISTTLRHPCPMANLPPEIQTQVFIELLHSKEIQGTYDCTPLILSKWYLNAFRQRLYTRIHIATHRRFRLLRETLALLNPSLGELIHTLIVASDSFDATGYVANPIAAQPTLSTGIEQLLLSMPNLRHLSLDLYSLAALWDGNGQYRLESGPKPVRLQTELTFPQYLELPMHEELQELDIMCFGLDDHAARDLRVALPRLKRLVIRLVRRDTNSAAPPVDWTTARHVRNGVHALAGAHAVFPGGAEPIDQEEDVDSRGLWSETPMGRKDADEFCGAIDVLRSWPIEKGTKDVHKAFQVHGDRLEAVTILAWPEAVRELQIRLGKDNAICRTPRQLDSAVELHRAEMTAVLSDGNAPPHRIPLTPLRLGLDAHRKVGPRRGCVMAWVEGA